MATADSTVVVIDETHRLMNHSPEAREALSIFVREARASNTAVTLLTQNASDFTDYKEGQDILDNTTAKIFHQHERVPTSVVQYFQLSNQEEQELYSLKTGGDTVTSEAIIKISNQLDTKITVRSTMPEHRIITAGEQGTIAAEAES
jgi:type IV secretory pathway VirB4 component